MKLDSLVTPAVLDEAEVSIRPKLLAHLRLPVQCRPDLFALQPTLIERFQQGGFAFETGIGERSAAR